MRKLKLDLEALAVESFPIEPGEEERGTVHGHAQTDAGPTCHASCIGDTCWDSCDGVCDTYYCTDDGTCGLTCMYARNVTTACS